MKVEGLIEVDRGFPILLPSLGRDLRLLCQSVFGREARLVERVDSARGPLRAASPSLRDLPSEAELLRRIARSRRPGFATLTDTRRRAGRA